MHFILLWLLLQCFRAADVYSNIPFLNERELLALMSDEEYLFSGALLECLDDVKEESERSLDTSDTSKALTSSPVSEKSKQSKESTKRRHKFKLSAFRDVVHKRILELNPHFKNSRNVIRWSQVCPIGWPQDVLFYSKNSWNLAECLSLLRAMDGERKITLLPGSKAPPVPRRQKEELKGNVERLSQALFGNSEIQWRKIKTLCPGLHLAHLEIMKYGAEDFRKLEEVARVLEAELAKRNSTESAKIEEDDWDKYEFSLFNDRLDNRLYSTKP